MIQNKQQGHGENGVSKPVRPIVFLDLDDVLVLDPQYTREHVLNAYKAPNADYSDLWNNLFCKAACANLWDLHIEFSPRFVISSNWSRNLTQEQFRDLFQLTNLNFVAENLHAHWTTPKGTGSPRLTEIEDWILSYRLDEVILVIDDEESGWSLHDSHLDRQGCVVLCEEHQGFNAAQLALAQMLLRAQMFAA
jgi:hypothetical protein